MKICADKPCSNCPWLKSSSTGGADIPNFDIALMRRLKNTVPPRGSDQDGFYNIMACHKSNVNEEFACAGYIARHGIQNINVRLMAATAGLNLAKVIDNCEHLDLYENFYEMLDDFETILESTDKPTQTDSPHLPFGQSLPCGITSSGKTRLSENGHPITLAMGIAIDDQQ